MSDVPKGMARVQCITDRRVWLDVRTPGQPPGIRPLDLDEVAIVARDEGFAIARKNRHVVEVVGEEEP